MCANSVPWLLGLFLLIVFLQSDGPARLWAQDTRPALTKFISDMDEPGLRFLSAPSLAPKELLLSMGTHIQTTGLDCSHFVQWLFEQAGLYYDYAPSRTLYDGLEGFKRVFHPRPGDLIVWPGHVGIVVDPDETTFLSALRTGVKTSSYTSHYWKRRGRARFFRYLNGSGDGPSRMQASRSAYEGHAASGTE